MSIAWAGRLATAGATATEVQAIQASYDSSVGNVQQALDTLIEGIDNAGLAAMLATWRLNGGPFTTGLPGGGLPFGTHVPLLTGLTADDTLAISAGTGQKLAVGGGGGSGLPSNFLTKTGAYTAAASDFVQANAAGGAFTVTLPLSPAVGALVTVVKTDASGNAVGVVAQGGGQVQGDPAGASITAQWAGATFEHAGSNVWLSAAVPTDYVGAMPVEPTAVKTAAYTAAVGDFVPCDISAGSFTVTLPSAPTDQARIGVKLVAVDGAHANSLTIARGGTDVFNIAGGATSLSLSALGQAVVLQYYAATGLWYVQARDTPLGQPLGAAQLGTNGKVGGTGGSAVDASIATVVESVDANSASGSGTVTLPDVTTDTVHELTLTGTPTLAFPAGAAGKSFLLMLTEDGTGGRTVTWPATTILVWVGGATPTLTATPGKTDAFSFVWSTQRSRWLGFVAGQNF